MSKISKTMQDAIDQFAIHLNADYPEQTQKIIIAIEKTLRKSTTYLVWKIISFTILFGGLFTLMGVTGDWINDYSPFAFMIWFALCFYGPYRLWLFTSQGLEKETRRAESAYVKNQRYHRCLKCSYDLHMLQSKNCPECGNNIHLPHGKSAKRKFTPNP